MWQTISYKKRNTVGKKYFWQYQIKIERLFQREDEEKNKESAKHERQRIIIIPFY